MLELVQSFHNTRVFLGNEMSVATPVCCDARKMPYVRIESVYYKSVVLVVSVKLAI